MDLLFRLALRVFPELLLFESEQERKTAFWEAGNNLTTGVCAMVLVSLIAYLVGYWADYLPSGAILPLAPMVPLLCGLPPLWLSKKATRRKLRRMMVEAGVPICLKCGYDLRGQVTPRCPECGTPFDEKLLRKRTNRQPSAELIAKERD